MYDAFSCTSRRISATFSSVFTSAKNVLGFSRDSGFSERLLLLELVLSSPLLGTVLNRCIPDVRQVDQRASLRCAGDHIEGFTQDAVLQDSIARVAKSIAHRMVDEHRAGRFHLLGDISGSGHDHGGDAGLFDDPGDQTHGLVIQGSSRDGNEHVNTIFQQLPGEGRTFDLMQDGTLVDTSHKAAP